MRAHAFGQIKAEGIIANRAVARDGENRNPERTGLGIVRRLIDAYSECWPRLRGHDSRYPAPEILRGRTYAGYDTTDDAVNAWIWNPAQVAIFRKGLKGVWNSSPIFANDLAALSW